MKRAIDVVRAGHWPTQDRTDTVTLLFDDRYRRRLRMLGDGGLDFLLDLAEPVLKHRMALTFSARADGETIGGMIAKLAARIG